MDAWMRYDLRHGSIISIITSSRAVTLFASELSLSLPYIALLSPGFIFKPLHIFHSPKLPQLDHFQHNI